MILLHLLLKMLLPIGFDLASNRKELLRVLFKYKSRVVLYAGKKDCNRKAGVHWS